MGCIIEFPESSVKIDFHSNGNNQKILIDVLTKYSEIDFEQLALIIGVSVRKLKKIYEGKTLLVGEQADSLAQLFLMFLAKEFFRPCKLIQTFDADS